MCSKIINLEGFKKNKKTRKNLGTVKYTKEEIIDAKERLLIDDIDMNERIFLEINTEYDNFEEKWKTPNKYIDAWNKLSYEDKIKMQDGLEE